VRQKKNCRLTEPDKLRIELALPDVPSRVAAICQAFGELAACRN